MHGIIIYEGFRLRRVPKFFYLSMLLQCQVLTQLCLVAALEFLRNKQSV